MAKFPFVDKTGQIFYYNPDEVKNGECCYIVVKKGDDVLCMLDETSLVYTLPKQSDAMLDAVPSGEFEIISYIIRHDAPLKEKQIYQVYEVGNVDLADTPLRWVKLPDILLGNVDFDATQKNGIKNLLVRGK